MKGNNNGNHRLSRLIVEAGCVSMTLHKRTYDDIGEAKLRWFEKIDYAREKLTK